MRTPLLTIILISLILLVMSCTAPPAETSDDTEPGVQSEQTTPAGDAVDQGTPEAGGPSDMATDMPMDEMMEETGGEAVDKDGDGTTEIIGLPDDIFGHYETWPPQSITPEETALLKKIVAVLETSKGTMKIRFFVDVAPLHSANFVKLCQDGYYDGLQFFRVVANFMSQCGDPNNNGTGGPEYRIPPEFGMTHEDGRVAAARTNNPQKLSSGSQFYICLSREGTAGLDQNYTVFGEVIEGIEVNHALNVTRESTQRGEVPIEGVVPDHIIRAYIELIEE